MSDPMDFTEDERERLYELMSIGASHAATAFTLLLHRAVAPSAPEFVDAAAYSADDSWCTGVIFQADGELGGLIAILLPAATCEIVAGRMIHENQDSDFHRTVESALRELGNIVASHTMSAIADRLGGRILLSVPLLVTEGADTAFESMFRERGAARCIECELTDSSRDIHVRLVVVPEAKLDPQP